MNTQKKTEMTVDTSKIMQIREETYQDVMNKLTEYGKCALIRPCSFGKTVMAVRIIQNYKKVLFLYPQDNVKNTLEVRYGDYIGNITFMTYVKLARSTVDELKAMDYDLVFADEVHHLGATKARSAFAKLLELMPCHVIGATATVERMDGINVVEEFFDGITVEPYTLHDAIADGVIHKPYYCFCSYGIKEDIENALNQLDFSSADKKVFGSDLENVLNSNLMEVANIHSMETVIRNVCDEYVKDTNYMKFISFFQKVADLRENIDMVAGWFKTAFPNHNVRILEVHVEARKNLELLEHFTPTDNTIDIIFSCDMLNECYHVNDLTGIVMCRKTQSSRIYIQQLGRVLSSEEDHDGMIVFDVVDNLHRKSLFGDCCEDAASDMEEFNENDSTPNEESDGLGSGPDEQSVTTELILSEEQDGCNSTAGFQFYEEETPWYLKANHIDRTDIYSVGNEAEYAEFIRKTVFEPIERRLDDVKSKYFSLGGKKYNSDAEWKRHKLDYQKLQAVARMFHITERAFVTAMTV